MGLYGLESTEEDLLCALYIKSLLEGGTVDFEKQIEIIENTSGAKFFDAQNCEDFPKEDFWLCLQRDKFDFVLSAYSGEDGFTHIKREK